MSKLVDRERLARLAQALDARMKAADKVNADAIAAINDAENGILAQAKADAAAKDGVLSDRITTLEGLVVGGEGEGIEKVIGDVADNKAAIAKLNGGVEEEGSVAKAVADGVKPVQDDLDAAELRIDALEADKPVKEAAIKAAQDAADQAQQEVDALEKVVGDAKGGLVKDLADEVQARKDAVQDVQDQLDALVGDGEGSVAEQIQAEANTREEADNALDDRIAAFEANGAQDVAAKEVRLAAAEANIARLDGTVEVEGSVKKQIKDAIDQVNGAAENLKNRVKANEDNLAIVMGNAEQAGSIAEAKAAADAAQADIDAFFAAANVGEAAVDTLKELQDYMSTHGEAAAKMVDDIAKAQKAADDEKVRAEGEEGKIRTEFAAADNQLKADLQAEIDADVKAEANRAIAEEERIAGLVETEKQRAEGVEAGFETRIKANENFVANHDHTNIESRISTLEGYHAVNGVIDERFTAIQNQITSNKTACEKAMAQEVIDRNAAITAALEPYSTTEEVKAILGNVVATLNLSIVEDKVVLKLGGAEGIALSEVSLDMATNDDIDAIIAGLDAPQA